MEEYEYDTVTCHINFVAEKEPNFDVSSAPPNKIIKNDEQDEGRIPKQFFDLSSFGDPYSETISAFARKEEQNHIGIVTDKFIWNTAYQRLIDLSFSSESKEKIKKELEILLQEFAQVVFSRSKIIIDELHLMHKTYYPCDIGGSLGGSKYIIDGILYKLAIPVIAGSSEDITAKINGHELKALESLIGCQIEKLYFPMIVVVDYKGYRVVGVSRLPVSETTIVSGSSNSGYDVKIPQGDQEEKLNHMCEKMKILPHEIINDANQKYKVYGPFDLEGHVGTDNRFYLLDFSRVLPPDFVKFSFSEEVSEVLKKSNETDTKLFVASAPHFCRLRPELLRKLDKPLCSDSFSKFDVDKDYHINQIEGAQSQLVKRIERFVQRKAGSCDFFTEEAINQLHQKGINLRYSGYLHHLFCESGEERNQNWIKFLRVEMVARVLLWIIRALLRETQTENQVTTVISELNSLLCERKNEYWDHKIMPQLVLRFHSFPARFACLFVIQKIELFFHSPENINSLLSRVFKLIGIEVSPQFIARHPLDIDFTSDLSILKHPKIANRHVL